jgi:hypothetical protein
MICAASRGTLIVAMHVKYCLARLKLAPDEQLKLLEALDRLPFADVTPEAIAALEPCDEITVEMIHSAMELPPAHHGGQMSAGWHVLEHDPVWSTLVSRNPSLATAMSLCLHNRMEQAA